MRTFFALAVMAVSTASLYAAEMKVSSPTPNAAALSRYVSPGRYAASIMPMFNAETSKRFEAALGSIAGIQEVDADHEQSSVKFTVAAGTSVPVALLREAVRRVHRPAVLSQPQLDDALTTEF